MRTFIAVEIPDAVRQAIGTYIQHIERPFGRNVKWVATDNLHFTLKFIGEIGEEKIELVRRCMEASVAENSPFTLTIGGIGCFPSPQQLRVVWIGVDGGCEHLLDINQALESCLEPAGFDRDDKPYSPHLTIGRAKKDCRVCLPGGVPDFEPETFDVSGIAMFKSTLTPRGPVYDRLFECPFRRME